MVVADQHDVDGRQILPRRPRFSLPPWTCPGQRTCAFGPNRVGQNVRAPLLKEHCRVVDQSGSESAAFDAARRYGGLDVRDETGRWFRPSGQLPSKNIEKPECLRSVRIV